MLRLDRHRRGIICRWENRLEFYLCCACKGNVGQCVDRCLFVFFVWMCVSIQRYLYIGMSHNRLYSLAIHILVNHLRSNGMTNAMQLEVPDTIAFGKTRPLLGDAVWFIGLTI